MMSGTQYNVTVCQILQSEKLIKISTILKLFSSNTMGGGSVSLKEFLKSFSISEESSNADLFDLDPYIRMLGEEEPPIALDTSLLQSLAPVIVFIQYSKVLIFQAR